MSEKQSLVGKHRARVIDHEFGYANNKPQVALMFELVEDGPLKGRTFSWFGFFTPETKDRTFDSLRACGWSGDDLEDLGSLEGAGGIYRNDVEIVVEESEYQGKKSLKVRWVNRLAKRNVDLKNKMTPEALRDFAAQMRGDATARRKEDKGATRGDRQESFDRGPGADANYDDDDQIPW